MFGRSDRGSGTSPRKRTYLPFATPLILSGTGMRYGVVGVVIILLLSSSSLQTPVADDAGRPVLQPPPSGEKIKFKINPKPLSRSSFRSLRNA